MTRNFHLFNIALCLIVLSFVMGCSQLDISGSKPEEPANRTPSSTPDGGLSGPSAPLATPDILDEPPPPPPVSGGPNKNGGVISGGVLNGKATSLPKPAYPPAAKAVHASGAVSVQVTVDESGKVISAKAVSGHPLLKAAAESAARDAVFTPTLLSGKPVKVSGIITYNFSLE